MNICSDVSKFLGEEKKEKDSRVLVFVSIVVCGARARTDVAEEKCRSPRQILDQRVITKKHSSKLGAYIHTRLRGKTR